MNKKKEEKEKGIGVWLFLVALLSIFLLFSQLQTSDYWGKLNACELDLEKIKNPVRPYDEEYFTDCIQGQLMVCVMEKVWDEWNTSQIGDVVTCYGLDESCAEETEEPLVEKYDRTCLEWEIGAGESVPSNMDANCKAYDALSGDDLLVCSFDNQPYLGTCTCWSDEWCVREIEEPITELEMECVSGVWMHCTDLNSSNDCGLIDRFCSSTYPIIHCAEETEEPLMEKHTEIVWEEKEELKEFGFPIDCNKNEFEVWDSCCSNLPDLNVECIKQKLSNVNWFNKFLNQPINDLNELNPENRSTLTPLAVYGCEVRTYCERY